MRILLAGCLLLLATSTNVRAGTITEVGDAGQSFGKAQDTTGTQPLTAINGTLNTVFGLPFDVDMYKIALHGGFTASVMPSGFLPINAQLFLFDANGHAVASNDSTSTNSASISGNLTGTYYLAISNYNNDPLTGFSLIPFSLGGQAMFNSDGTPTSAGQTFSLGFWNGDVANIAFSTNYTINLTATPEPASMTLLGIGALGMAGYGWRRRKLAKA